MNYEYLRIQRALKSAMKSKGETYPTLAKALGVSPATVKRRLNGSDMTLQQLKEIAEALSLSFYEIIELSKQAKREPHLFTEDQEKFLSRDLWIAKLFRFILGGQDFSHVQSSLKVSEADLRKAAKELEKVGLARLLPNDRFIPLVHFPFKWRPGGPLSKAYDELIFKNIISRASAKKNHSAFNRQFEMALSPNSFHQFCQELEGLYSKYRNLSEIHLSSSLRTNEAVSGILFIDQFSIWE